MCEGRGGSIKPNLRYVVLGMYDNGMCTISSGPHFLLYNLWLLSRIAVYPGFCGWDRQANITLTQGDTFDIQPWHGLRKPFKGYPLRSTIDRTMR